ncbi:hypothetical protein Hanom_Chr11g01058971 [Helianthus anomalus]
MRQEVQQDSDVEPIRLRHSLLHGLHSQPVTDSTTRTYAKPRGSNHHAPTSSYSENTNSHKEDISCLRRPAQGPSAHLLLHSLRL